MTQAEIEVMLEQGAQTGVLSETESEVAQSVFRLAEQRVGALMTPRMNIAWLDVSGSTEETRDLIAKFGHSRYPVCDGSLDNVLGVVEAQQLLTVGADGTGVRFGCTHARARLCARDSPCRATAGPVLFRRPARRDRGR